MGDAGGRDDAARGEKSGGEKSDQAEPTRGDQLERSPDKARDDNARGDKSRDDGRQSRGDGSDDGEKPRSRWPLIILAVVVVAAIIAGAVYWWLTRNLESTDDAYTEGNAVAYAAKVSGYVTQLNVDDNTFVHKGDLLLKIDPRDYTTARDESRANLSLARSQLSSSQVALDIARVQAPASLQQAQAALAQAQATKQQAEQEYRRQHAVDPRATTQTNIDQANAQMRSTTASVVNAEAQVKVAQLVQQNIQSAEDTVHQRQAQVAQSEASLAQAEVNLSYTNLIAPQDGYITRRNVDKGTFLQAGQQVFYIVTPDVWVTANFKENQLTDMHPGQHVTMDVDAYPGLHLEGHIDSIQQGSGARFSTFPAENATGNFVKIVRRVPVKIIIDHGLENNQILPLGISVEPTVTVR